jgi:hypothetical protein
MKRLRETFSTRQLIMKLLMAENASFYDVKDMGDKEWLKKW